METLTAVIIGFQIISVILLLILIFRKKDKGQQDLSANFETLERALDKISLSLREELLTTREEFNRNARELREETQGTFTLFQDSFTKRMTDNLNQIREQLSKDAKENREELSASLHSFGQSFTSNVKDFNDLQKSKFDSLITAQTDLSKLTEDKLEKLRKTIEEQLKYLQEQNSKKLDEMRQTVDEKLQTTLEKRLSESFKQVSERLEQVHQGLGDMKNLATDVGDLKKVLSNVKSRGILGEYQLDALLNQILTPEQFEANVKCREDKEFRVEYAIKLPGKDEEDKQVYLPIDAKFPIEDYHRLQDAYDKGDVALIEETRKALEKTIEKCAKDIKEKYINPPTTTDFAILFLPFESLYAEVLSREGLFERMQQVYKVVISGPTTLGALLNSLQMGFRTLTIQKRSSQVWKVLGEVKTEFGRFGDVMQQAKKNIDGAGEKLELLIGRRTRAIERRLQDVEALPIAEDVELVEVEE